MPAKDLQWRRENGAGRFSWLLGSLPLPTLANVGEDWKFRGSWNGSHTYFLPTIKWAFLLNDVRVLHGASMSLAPQLWLNIPNPLACSRRGGLKAAPPGADNSRMHCLRFTSLFAD